MPNYAFQCEVCYRREVEYRTVDNRNDPKPCGACLRNGRGSNPMVRLIGQFQTIIWKEIDKPENQLYRILTNNGTQADQLELMREDEKKNDVIRAEDEAFAHSQPGEVTVEDIVGKMGLAEAARSGEQGIANWSEKNIPKEVPGVSVI